MSVSGQEQLEKKISDSYEIPNNVLKVVPKPIVSVRTSAYQHAKYIKQCIEGVLMQKTNFPIEYIIGEDFSTDGTREIVLEYAEKYPDVIRVVTADYNVGMKANGRRCIERMRGKYIAVCEGDDYWTDPYKLQKQVDFLEKHKDYAFCFHPVRVFFENKEEEEFIAPQVDANNEVNFTVKRLLQGNFIYTNSVMYRKQKDESTPPDVIPGDWYAHLYHAQFGKIGFINEVMSIYRRHPGGIWWDSHKNKDQIWVKYGLGHLALYAELLKLYGDNAEYRDILNTHIFHALTQLIEVDKKYIKDLLATALHKFPNLAEIFILGQYQSLNAKDIELQKKEEELAQISRRLERKKYLLKQKREEIKTMKASRFWKVRNIIVRLIGK
jgi:glycosyltransferase involved in cell wall biosynthesis